MDNDSAVQKEETTDTCSNLNESSFEVDFYIEKKFRYFYVVQNKGTMNNV